MHKLYVPLAILMSVVFFLLFILLLLIRKPRYVSTYILYTQTMHTNEILLSEFSLFLSVGT